MRQERWCFSRPRFSFDAQGIGVGVYTVDTGLRCYSLICFGHDLPADQRTDRVIAQAWDATFTLFDGVPTEADIDRLKANIPKQEAGRVSAKEIVISRANRSVTLFAHVVSQLAAGQQPDSDLCARVGYLMRTTAVYGSGKLGAADRESLSHRQEFYPPFQAEMLAVYLIRLFTFDLVDEMARQQAPDTAVPMAAPLRAQLGVGNSTGLGMAPFLLNHPTLLHQWIAAREHAFASVCQIETATSDAIESFTTLLKRVQHSTAQWFSDHPLQIRKIAALRADLVRLSQEVAHGALLQPQPWLRLYRWSETHLSLEGQEQLVSLMLEPYIALIAHLQEMMSSDESRYFPIDGAMRLTQLRTLLETDYRWALETDWDAPQNQARVWYVSAQKLEPRLGERFQEPIAAYEQPLAPGRDTQKLYADLLGFAGAPSVAAFLLQHPEHRHSVRRVQITARFAYAEIRDNTIAQDMLPIDMLRCKLSFFGAIHFNPRSDRWVRIVMFKNAPLPDIDTNDICAQLPVSAVDDWIYPTLENLKLENLKDGVFPERS